MTAAMQVLEPIFEADLPPELYAYRPGRNAKGPTHFSQFAPLGERLWGEAWFETGCLSALYREICDGKPPFRADAAALNPIR